MKRRWVMQGNWVDVLPTSRNIFRPFKQGISIMAKDVFVLKHKMSGQVLRVPCHEPSKATNIFMRNVLRAHNRIDSKESIPPTLCSLAGRYDSPILTRFLAPIDYLKIPVRKGLQIWAQRFFSARWKDEESTYSTEPMFWRLLTAVLIDFLELQSRNFCYLATVRELALQSFCTAGEMMDVKIQA